LASCFGWLFFSQNDKKVCIVFDSLFSPSTSGRAIRVGHSLAALCALALAGCSSGDTGSAITGTVKLNGTALTTGQVLAVNEQGQTASGQIAPDGTYKVVARDGRGLQPGHYDLAVIAYEGGDSANPEAPRKLLVPQKYTEVTTSGFEADVEAGKTTATDLELKSN
jgi:phage tail sheath gpL-like